MVLIQDLKLGIQNLSKNVTIKIFKKVYNQVTKKGRSWFTRHAPEDSGTLMQSLTFGHSADWLTITAELPSRSFPGFYYPEVVAQWTRKLVDWTKPTTKDFFWFEFIKYFKQEWIKELKKQLQIKYGAGVYNITVS